LDRLAGAALGARRVRGRRDDDRAVAALTEKQPPQAPVGEAGVGENARRQLAAARNDPRLNRGRAAVADYWDALQEAEHTRMLAILGAYELRGALDRYEREQGVSRDDPALHAAHQGTMQALWEQAELASAAIDTDFAALNAQALVSMNSALDAMVEEFAPALREIMVMATVDAAFAQTDKEHPEVAGVISEEMRRAYKQALEEAANKSLPKLDRLLGSGAERYEGRLRGVGLGTARERPIPADLDEALRELGAIRDVLTHRHGRVDAKALEQAPSLARRYNDGDFIRLTRSDYRTYSAAIRCYGQDVAMRPMRTWPEFKEENMPNLAGWRNYYIAGV
jgi:hypothetical protein